jgi:predicted DNA binding CopG/RHH family protein
MRAEYDFSKGKKNPYAKKLKKQITINIDSETIDYFKRMSEANSIPYQTLINLYLSDCVIQKKQLQTTWSEGEKTGSMMRP